MHSGHPDEFCELEGNAPWNSIFSLINFEPQNLATAKICNNCKRNQWNQKFGRQAGK